MMKSSLTLLATFAPVLFAWEYDTPYPMPLSHRMGEAGRSDTAWYFDTVATLGRYARTSSIVHEGGWSGLERDTTDPTGHSFWTVSEGGLAVSRESGGRNDRLIAFPGHHQKLARVVLSGGTLSIERVAIRGFGPGRPGWGRRALERRTGRIAGGPAGPGGKLPGRRRDRARGLIRSADISRQTIPRRGGRPDFRGWTGNVSARRALALKT